METQTRFILVDDDPINNMLNELCIKIVFPHAQVLAFTEPEKGLDYLLSHFNNPNALQSVLLLDLNMNIMTGWEFMDHFEKADPKVKEKLLVHVLSSSVNPIDKEKAKSNPNIIDFIEKPLSDKFLRSLIKS